MRIFIVLHLILLVYTSTQEVQAQRNNARAHIIGGYDSLRKAIRPLIVTPSGCPTGKVIVNFQISKRGKTFNAQVLKGLCPNADSIALKIVASVRFTPEIKNGNKVVVWQSIPFDFYEERK